MNTSDAVRRLLNLWKDARNAARQYEHNASRLDGALVAGARIRHEELAKQKWEEAEALDMAMKALLPDFKEPAPFERRVDSSKEAPLGRYGGLSTSTREHLHLRRVPLIEGHDPGGAYWSTIGAPLWCAWVGDGSDPEKVAYFRAPAHRDSAKRCFPNATFFK